jgi:hypothetical protein
MAELAQKTPLPEYGGLNRSFDDEALHQDALPMRL